MTYKNIDISAKNVIGPIKKYTYLKKINDTKKQITEFLFLNKYSLVHNYR